MTSLAKNSPARSVADVDSGTILATVEIAASPERVFRALTTPEEVVRWWGSDTEYQTEEWVQDLRVGGAWRASGKGADGTPFSVAGEFLEIEPPRRLVQSWKPDWDGGHTTRLTYKLDVIDGGTRVTVRHEGFGDRHDSCRSHGIGWSSVLNWLAAFAGPTPQKSTEQYFLCRLNAPRPTFPFDMTDEERELMGQHFGYWTQRMSTGRALIFAPVGDPKGVWGLGIVKAEDEQEVKTFQQGDPLVRANRGFSYELFPLMQAVVRE